MNTGTGTAMDIAMGTLGETDNPMGGRRRRHDMAGGRKDQAGAEPMPEKPVGAVTPSLTGWTRSPMVLRS